MNFENDGLLRVKFNGNFLNGIVNKDNALFAGVDSTDYLIIKHVCFGLEALTLSYLADLHLLLKMHGVKFIEYDYGCLPCVENKIRTYEI